MNWKRILKKTAFWATVGTVTLALLLSALFGLAQTEMGKRQMAQLLAKSLGKASDFRIEVGKIDGIIPFYCRLDRLIFNDAAGEMLVLENVVLRWSPVALLKGHFYVKELSASLLRMNRFSPKFKDDKATPKRLPTWPSVLNRLSIDRFAIDRLVLGRDVVGEEGAFRLGARLSAVNATDEQVAEFHLVRTDGPKAEATISIVLKHKESFLLLRAKIEEAEEGLLATLMGLPGPIVLNVDGEGPLTGWRGGLKASVGGLGDLQTSLAIDTLDEPKLKAEGLIRVTSGQLPAQVEDLLSDETRFAAVLRMPHNQSIVVDYLNADTGKISLQLKGALDFEQQSSTGQFILNCADLRLLGDLVGSRIAGSMEIDGSFSGPLLNPQTTLLVNIRNVESDKFRADVIHADLRATFPVFSVKAFSGLKLTGSGSIKNFAVRDMQTMPEPLLNWDIDAEGPFNDTIQIRKLRLSGETISLDGSGLLNLADLSGKGEAFLAIEDLRKISGLFSADIPGNTKTRFSFDGNAAKRWLSVRIQGQLTMPEGSSTRLTPLLGSAVNYAGEIKFTEAHKLSVYNLRLDALAGKLTGNASLDLESEKLDSSLQIFVPKLAFLAPVLNRTIDGSLEMDSVINGSLSSPNVHVKAKAKNLLFEQLNFPTLTAKIHFEGLPPQIQGRSELALNYEGHELSGMGDFLLEGQHLSLSALSIKSGENEVTGKLALDLKNLRADGKLHGKARRLSDLSFLLGQDLTGDADIKAEFKVVDREQRASLDIDGRDLSTRFGQAKKLGVTAKLIDPFKGPRGNVILEGTELHLGEVTLATLALTGEGTAGKTSFHGRSTGNYKGRFDVETKGTFYSTSNGQKLELKEFRGHYKDLPLALLRPAAINRSASGYRLEELSLQVGGGSLNGSGHLENQKLTVKANFKHLPLGDLPLDKSFEFAGTATGSLYLLGPVGRPQGNVELYLDGLTLHDLKMSEFPPARLNAKAKLEDSRLLAEFTLQGLTAKPVDARLDLPLSLSLSPFRWSLPSHGELRGDLTGEIDLKSTNLLIGVNDQNLEGLLDFSLNVSGTVANPDIRGGFQVKKGIYKEIRSDIANASIRFLSPVDRPRGNIKLRLDKLTFRDPQTSGLSPATVEAKAELEDGRLITKVSVQGLSTKPLELNLDIPFSLAFFPLDLSFPHKAELRGALAGDLDLEQINTFFRPDYQLMRGRLYLNLSLKGTMDKPLIMGQGHVRKGYYEYIPTGTVLRDSEVEITAEIPRLIVKQARATDGERGTISLKGWLDLIPSEQFPFNIDLTLEDAALLRRDDATASAEGRVTLSGSFTQAKLGGQLHIGHAEVRIPDQLPPEITDLQLIEIGENTQKGQSPPVVQSSQAFKLLLDLHVDSPGKIFVRGRGLDSEWKCAFRTAGTAREPIIIGNLSVVRGHFDFLGKRFGIRRGSVTFSGTYPPSPIIDITAEARAKDITAQLQLSGSLKTPKLMLTSDPPLPSDEILSRLLFGRTLTAITPFQALALADAARTLAGGGGLSFLEQTRKLLRVDQLEIKTDDQQADQTTIGAGKYLSDRVYLEVEQGLDTQSSKASVQVEVTPNITLESEIGANSEGGIGLKWKWDY